jgi:DNA-binding NarL/FixJ family response regulator
VATLVAEGLSNRQIGDRLVITERTAENHVAHILNRLGFRTRVQIAAWATERGLRRGRVEGNAGGTT